MEAIEYRNIDKSEYGPGPWQNEPDKAQFTDEATGLPCLIVRQPSLGHLCGYVGVAEGHPAFGKPYDSVDVDVHGGLTYADFCMEEKDVPTGHNVICHIVEPGENDRVWWLGFDCAHSGDRSPGMARYGHERDYETYKSFGYVKAEVARLATQLAAMQTVGSWTPNTDGRTEHFQAKQTV